MFFMAMAPVVELRGAIPLGVGLGLSPAAALAWALLGNLLVVPPLLAVLPWGIEQTKRWPRVHALWRRLEARVRLKGEEKVQRYGAIGLFLFVAVPLPGTGAWTGSVLAAVLGVKKRYALPAIAAGVAVAGGLVFLATTGAIRGLSFLVR